MLQSWSRSLRSARRAQPERLAAGHHGDFRARGIGRAGASLAGKAPGAVKQAHNEVKTSFGDGMRDRIYLWVPPGPESVPKLTRCVEQSPSRLSVPSPAQEPGRP